jgi:hypothetical protein
MKISVLVAAVIATSGCTTDGDVEEQIVSTESGETPYWGCWSYAGWSGATWGDGTTVCNSRSTAIAARGQCVKDRGAEHPYSVIVSNSYYVNTASASGWNVFIACTGGGYYTGWRDDIYLSPGCPSGTVNQAQINVRAAGC